MQRKKYRVSTFPKADLNMITRRYALLVNIPLFRDSQGRRWADAMWHKDLARHLTYIESFVLVSPLLEAPVPADYVCLEEDPVFSGATYVDLPYARSSIAFIAQTFRLLTIFNTFLNQTDILHAGVAGWPFPYGWLAIPMAKWKKKYVVVVVESAFWRTSGTQDPTLRQRVREFFSERINRWCVNAADLAVFTQPEYRDALLTKKGKTGHVVQASWIDAAQVATEDQAHAAWEAKLEDHTAPLRLLFAGRLLPEKGVNVLLESAAKLRDSTRPITITIIGEGALKNACQEAAANLPGPVRLEVLDPVPYEDGFMDLLAQQHAVLVPSLSDEQPRIVYDAYSQAVPILASLTPGLEACVIAGETGRFVPPGDADALTALLAWAEAHREQLRNMGMRALESARGYTHETMHDIRHKLLLEMLGEPSNGSD